MFFELNILLMDLIMFFILLILNLICMAFLTLLERKLLSLIQFRVGPNKVGFIGILQPFSDAIKLLNKEIFLIMKSKFLVYNLMPIMMFLLSSIIWLIYPLQSYTYKMNCGILFMLSVIGLNVYPVMLGGWISNSNYSMLGSIRSIAQSISYEVSLFMILFSLILMVEDLSLYNFFKYQYYMKFFIFLSPLYLMFMISMLVELNRAPFDLVEGESELVSGFNVEYFSSMFTLIFMAEYLSIIFVSFLTVVLFFGIDLMSYSFGIFLMFHIILVIKIRSISPRIRYDQLMDMCWKKFLLISLSYILINLMFKEVIILNFIM
uniref:NADH-ubiquinone oxidoreductase chain 1 n=1 Tax=Nomia chalybeata TaxID=2448184 RepID=A0A7L8EYC6_9HYME|nr:NADH dehydrogenase subunit 1 [Nomia chalybeata]QOE17511.1 NADH dehydrogenase subunit 1 [Nomia chalybeata]